MILPLSYAMKGLLLVLHSNSYHFRDVTELVEIEIVHSDMYPS